MRKCTAITGPDSLIVDICIHNEYWPAEVTNMTAQECMDICFAHDDCPQSDYYPGLYATCWVYRMCSDGEDLLTLGGAQIWSTCNNIGM